MKILVVDDDRELLAAQARLLKYEGYEVLQAWSGSRALELIYEETPDLVLLDVVMPELGGVEVCQRIKNDPLIRNTFVVLLSSVNTSSDQQANGLEAGADGFIARPLPGRELVARVQAMLRIKQTEEALRTALAEKGLLLQEINHRVKNNLEIIISLAELQYRRISDREAQACIQELQERIRTIALVHESLCHSNDLNGVRALPFLQKLTDNLQLAFGSPDLQLELDIEDLVLEINQSTPCGMIVNELVTNAYKHAFPKECRSEGCQDAKQPKIIWVCMHCQNDQTVLEVRDNGAGLPVDFDWKNARSLGLRLVNRLSEQLHGKLEVLVENGTYFRLTFA